MRIDPDTCRDPDLLAGEVRRLQQVIENFYLLTDAEREAVERQADWMSMQAQQAGDIHSADLRSQEAATLRGLLERTK